MMDESLKIASQLQDSIIDSHCRFHRMLCLKSFIEVAYGLEGCVEPAFASLEHARKGFRMYTNE